MISDPTDVIYLDNAAATRCDPRVVEILVRHHTDVYGNPGASGHAHGRAAAHAVATAREQVRQLAAASLPRDEVGVVFVSGATEGNNLVLNGLAQVAPRDRRRIVTTTVEHASVLQPLRALRAHGFEIIECPVDADGRVDLDAMRALVDETTAFVSVQLANNELGTIQPVDRIADIAHNAGAIIHCDAAQAIGKIPVDIGVLDVDVVTFSGGKFYGPKGTGAIVARIDLLEQLPARTIGGGQEAGVRSGTHDVPGITGLGEAARIATTELEVELRRIAYMRMQMEELLIRTMPGTRITGTGARRVPGISSVVVPEDISAPLVLALARDIAASTGSACSTGGPSHVLRAIGLNDREAGRTMRLSLGRFTSEQDVMLAVSSITRAVAQLRRRADRTGAARELLHAGLER